jgi:hypothetical protein
VDHSGFAARYEDLALGLEMREEYPFASSVAGCSLDFLPRDIPPELRVRCQIRVPRQDAKAVAERLLRERDGLEVGALIQYLPPRTKVADLGVTVGSYSRKKKRIGAEEKARLDSALIEITQANRLRLPNRMSIVSSLSKKTHELSRSRMNFLSKDMSFSRDVHIFVFCGQTRR